MGQGTVKEFSAETQTGSVLLDDGTEIPIPAEAFARSGLLDLRFGQRVRFQVAGDDDARRITSIGLVTMSRD
jgi:cold shock CspA family protein